MPREDQIQTLTKQGETKKLEFWKALAMAWESVVFALQFGLYWNGDFDYECMEGVQPDDTGYLAGAPENMDALESEVEERYAELLSISRQARISAESRAIEVLRRSMADAHRYVDGRLK